jgi:hypothetical protein
MELASENMPRRESINGRAYNLNLCSGLVKQRQHLVLPSSLPHNRLLGNLGFGENIKILLT